MCVVRTTLLLVGAALLGMGNAPAAPHKGTIAARTPRPESAKAPSAASDGTITRRTTLLVYDLGASIQFYQTLGFEKWYEGPIGAVSGKGLPVEDIKTGDPTQLVIMRGKDPYVGMIGLLQYGPKRPPPPMGKMRIGDAILMIETKGLDAIAKQLKARGYHITKPPEISHIKSVGAEWDAAFMYVFDPDGRMVELTERLN